MKFKIMVDGAFCGIIESDTRENAYEKVLMWNGIYLEEIKGSV